MTHGLQTASYIEMSTGVLGASVLKSDATTYVIYKEEYTEEKNKMGEQHNFQEWCKEILPIVKAAAEGYDIEWLSTDGKRWSSYSKVLPEALSFSIGESYRIKPKIIMVNGFEVPEPLSSISRGEIYFIPISCGTHVF